MKIYDGMILNLWWCRPKISEPMTYKSRPLGPTWGITQPQEQYINVPIENTQYTLPTASQSRVGPALVHSPIPET